MKHAVKHAVERAVAPSANSYIVPLKFAVCLAYIGSVVMACKGACLQCTCMCVNLTFGRHGETRLHNSHLVYLSSNLLLVSSKALTPISLTRVILLPFLSSITFEVYRYMYITYGEDLGMWQ